MELSSRIKCGDLQARDELINGNLRFVIYVAIPFQNCGLPLSDLISAGNLGLITAADRFDGDMGNKFITYAVWWIRQSILKALEEDVHTVRMPLNKVAILRKVRKALPTMDFDDFEESDLTEISKDLKFSETEIRELINSRDMCYFEENLGNADSLNGNLYSDITNPAPDTSSLRESARRQIDFSFHKLNNRDYQIIKLYFGLEGGEPHTLQEIGEKMGLTRERIRQIKEKSLHKLRRSICFQSLETLATLSETGRD